MEIRKFVSEDAEETARMIRRTLRISNSKDYSLENIEKNIDSHSATKLLERAKHAHMYVACDDDKIVGCGGIDCYWGSKTESIILTVFVMPEYQNKGLGKTIIRTIEKDEFFLRAERVEIPASITACEFYRKLGYSYKNGITAPDAQGCIRLEKQRLTLL